MQFTVTIIDSVLMLNALCKIVMHKIKFQNSVIFNLKNVEKYEYCKVRKRIVGLWAKTLA